MAIRYTAIELKFLRDSPLVVKPPGLPPREEWMGPQIDPTRNSTKPATDRAKNHDSNILLDQTNRRPGAEKHMSRNSANPEDIILGPPRTSFMSATSVRNASKTLDSERPPLRDADSRDRYNFRGKAGEGDNDRSRDNRNNTLRPKRTDGDQDSDGWSTVKPRKSFGTEGAERFNGRMGVDRHREDRRFKDREDRDLKDKPRGFDTFSRDKDGDHDQDRENRRNGAGRGRNEPSWFRDRDNEGPPAPKDRNSNGDRFVDRSRGWREKDRDDKVERSERGDRGDRGDRRWERDRDQRQEREPAWMDEPSDEKSHGHTQEEFQKWKEQMQGKDKPGKPIEDTAKPDAGAAFFGLDKPKVETPLEIVDTGPDKFFGMWAPKDEVVPDEGIEVKKEGVAKAKTTGKSSRFTSFFAPQEEPPRRQTEPPPPMLPPPQGGLEGLFSSNSQSVDEKAAFQQLLLKLHNQHLSAPGSAPPANISLQPRPPPENQQGNPIPGAEHFQQYRPERQDEGRQNTRNSQQALQDLLNQRQIAGSQPTIRAEQMLQELVGQRQNAVSQSSVRPDQPPNRNTNTEFLMGLMQSAKAAPDPQRSEQALLRMPPRAMDRQQIEREQEMQREAAAQRDRSASQRRPPPGFYEDPAAFQRGPPPQLERPGGNPPQPTQILQRPPPPGLDMGWDRQGQMPPPHRIVPNIAPPPGLPNGPNRGMPMPQMFPPGFPMGQFTPPDVIPGPPRNMQMQPPPGFFNGPPPGFMPPGMGGFHGPEGMAFGGAPFDGRGPPPQGAFRRQ